VKFKRETEFQETEIGKIPKEWRVVKLKQVAEIRGTKKAPESVESVVFIPMEAVPDNRLYVSCEIRDSSEVKNYVYCEPGDILLAKITPSFENGKQGIVPDNIPGKFALATTEVYPIKCNNIDKLFLFYLLKYPPIRSKLASLMRGTTGRRRVPREALENTSLPHPPIYEQKVIAGVLSTVDRVIEVVDAGVVRLEGLKKALMRELLTGRIRVREENGKPVFYRETDFQDTEIGKIPREWRIAKLNRIAQIIMGQSPPSETYNKDGIGMPFLQGKMEFGRIYPSPVMYASNPIKIAEPNDVLISVRAPVGDVNIAPYRICIGRGLAAIHFDPNQTNHMFFFYYFQSIKERLETLSKGSTFKAITKKDLEELTVINPSLKEQKLIAEILSTVDRTIELYREERIRLDRLKRGLMDLLLTGKIRVVED
jgi:type I restriction enzyme S subunit